MQKLVDTPYTIEQYGLLDLSVDNPELIDVDVSSCSDLDHYINQVRLKQGRPVLMGGYLEHRAIYDRSQNFQNEAKRRNIHLGIDIWTDAETVIFALDDAVVHSMANNLGLGNYGPTILLRHDMDGQTLYTLYGHLSLASLEQVRVGERIEKGEVIGWLGSPAVNGDYPPHLHFQIIKNIENYQGDYPGVASKSNLEYYKANCPDPLCYLSVSG